MSRAGGCGLGAGARLGRTAPRVPASAGAELHASLGAAVPAPAPSPEVQPRASIAELKVDDDARDLGCVALGEVLLGRGESPDTIPVREQGTLEGSQDGLVIVHEGDDATRCVHAMESGAGGRAERGTGKRTIMFESGLRLAVQPGASLAAIGQMPFHPGHLGGRRGATSLEVRAW